MAGNSDAATVLENTVAELTKVYGRADAPVVRALQTEVDLCRRWTSAPMTPGRVLLWPAERETARREAAQLIAAQRPIRQAIVDLRIEPGAKREFLKRFDEDCSEIVAIHQAAVRRMTRGDRAALVSCALRTATVLLSAISFGMEPPTRNQGPGLGMDGL